VTLVDCSNCGRTWNLAVSDQCPVCGEDPDEPRPDGGTGPAVLADGGVVCSDHLAMRWDERTDPDAVAPETAWEEASRLRDAEILTGADECRYHRDTGTILLRNKHTLVTAMLPYLDERLELAVEQSGFDPAPA
jgi:hypothetical protein